MLRCAQGVRSWSTCWGVFFVLLLFFCLQWCERDLCLLAMNGRLVDVRFCFVVADKRESLAVKAVGLPSRFWRIVPLLAFAAY